MPLIEKTLFKTIDKVAMAIERIKAFEPEEGYFVAFSGGKDSVVLLDLIRRSCVLYDVHYNFTTVDPPELLYFIRKEYPDIEWHRPERSMWQLIIDKRMPPTRLVRYCCQELKETSGEGRLVVTGIRWAESVRRKSRRMVERCMRGKDKRYLHPIIDWEDSDIWEYINKRNLSYCSLYDEGFKRIGCVGCPMSGKHREKEFNRWPSFERAYRRAFRLCIEKRKELGLGCEGWKDADSLWDWWMNETRKKEDERQIGIFE